MKIISIQVYSKGISSLLTTADRANVYFKDPSYFRRFLGFLEIKFIFEINI